MSESYLEWGRSSLGQAFSRAAAEGKRVAIAVEGAAEGELLGAHHHAIRVDVGREAELAAGKRVAARHLEVKV